MRITNKILLTVTMFSMVGFVLASEANDENDLKAISPYKTWTRVNPTPLQISVESIGG